MKRRYREMIYKSKQGKMIGELDEGIYRKTVSKSKHLFKATGGSWGIQDEVLKQLPDDTIIQISEKEEKVVYSTTAKEFRKNCTFLQFGDFGKQAFLSLDKFTRKEVIENG
jgi:hypothetical protein